MQGPRVLRLFCISDTHGSVPPIPTDCDFVLHGGDICQSDPTHVDELANLLHQSGKPALVIEGNHDTLHPINRDFVDRCTKDEQNSLRVDVGNRLRKVCDERVRFLRDECAEIEGLGTVYAFGWHGNRFAFDWDSVYRGQDKQIDILMVHQPPAGDGDGDETDDYWRSKALSVTLREFCRRKKPALVVCGHVHAAFGIYRIGETTVVNCAVQMDEEDATKPRPGVMVEYDSQTRKVLSAKVIE